MAIVLFVGVIIIDKFKENEEHNNEYVEIKDDDSYVSDLEEDDSRNLIFSVSSSRVNCYTNILFVYDDNTYTFGSIDGSYTYDVYKILDSVNNYEPNNHGPFILKDKNNNEFYLYDNNVELNEFVDSIDIYLDICATVYQ